MIKNLKDFACIYSTTDLLKKKQMNFFLIVASTSVISDLDLNGAFYGTVISR